MENYQWARLAHFARAQPALKQFLEVAERRALWRMMDAPEQAAASPASGAPAPLSDAEADALATASPWTANEMAEAAPSVDSEDTPPLVDAAEPLVLVRACPPSCERGVAAAGSPARSSPAPAARACPAGDFRRPSGASSPRGCGTHEQARASAVDSLQGR
jgi:hypothetical protein